ncbi:MAG: stage III sporulation protein AF [Clostridia bacterium]|jgi:stage III sporulation protein AF|nr:stage III sporulation protein AF [Clostridia bacterium]MEE0790401.1 stage III sporulation protein AF [Clostridia bacterium]HJJ09016.1 stage III sporulation protein AF [Clostridiaceae bacterium]
MISWISSWAQGIIMAVIIGAIIEMILPEGNSKKYVKIVIGVYVLFTIISPVISKITGKTIQVSDILELNKYIEETENNSKLYVTLDEDNSNNIKDIYESSLRNDIKAKVAAKGYNAKNIKLEIEDDEEYTLKKIDIEIYKNMEKDKKDIETIQNVDINISQKSTENDMQEKLSEKDKRKLKDYLSGVYEIDEKNININ